MVLVNDPGRTVWNVWFIICSNVVIIFKMCTYFNCVGLCTESHSSFLGVIYKNVNFFNAFFFFTSVTNHQLKKMSLHLKFKYVCHTIHDSVFYDRDFFPFFHDVKMKPTRDIAPTNILSQCFSVSLVFLFSCYFFKTSLIFVQMNYITILLWLN